MNIELGCGNNPIKRNTPDVKQRKIDYRIDVLYSVCGNLHVDIVSNVSYLPLLNNSVDCFVSQHIIEHFDHKARDTYRPSGLLCFIREIYRSLKPGGHYETMSPNFAFIAREYCTRGYVDPQYAYTLMQWAMGGQSNEWDYHYVLLDFNILKMFATQAGFKPEKITLLHPIDWFGLHVKMEK